MMVNKLGCCNAGVERACRSRERHRADAWEKLGKETGKQQAFVRGFEHHGKIVKRKGRKNCVLGKKTGRTSPSYKYSRVNPMDSLASVWSDVSQDILPSILPNKAMIQRVHEFLSTDPLASVGFDVSRDIFTSIQPNKVMVQRVYEFFPRRGDNMLVLRLYNWD